jgi:hypothetical protein
MRQVNQTTVVPCGTVASSRNIDIARKRRILVTRNPASSVGCRCSDVQSTAASWGVMIGRAVGACEYDRRPRASQCAGVGIELTVFDLQHCPRLGAMATVGLCFCRLLAIRAAGGCGNVRRK